MTPSAFSTGLAGTCPRCGKGALFKGYLTVARRCQVCGLDYSKADSGDGPAVFIIFALGFLLVPIAVWVEFSAAPSVWLHILLWPLVILILSLLLLRPAKGVLIALQYKNEASDSGTVSYSDER